MSAKRKNHYYCLVFTAHGPVFVTKILPHHVCQWKDTDKPLELSKSDAEFMPIGLSLNCGVIAMTVVMPYVIEDQIYVYSKGRFKWVPSEETKETAAE